MEVEKREFLLPHFASESEEGLEAGLRGEAFFEHPFADSADGFRLEILPDGQLPLEGGFELREGELVLAVRGGAEGGGDVVGGDVGVEVFEVVDERVLVEDGT